MAALFNVLLIGAGAINFGTTEGPWCHVSPLPLPLRPSTLTSDNEAGEVRIPRRACRLGGAGHVATISLAAVYRFFPSLHSRCASRMAPATHTRCARCARRARADSRKLGERLNVVAVIDPDTARAERELAKKRVIVSGYAETKVFKSIDSAGAGLAADEAPR